MSRWAPIDVLLLQSLKFGSLHSKVDAALVLTVDRMNGVEKSAREYARQWGWSADKVIRFMKEAQSYINLSRDTDATPETSIEAGSQAGTRQQRDKTLAKTSTTVARQSRDTDATPEASIEAGSQAGTRQQRDTDATVTRRLFIKAKETISLGASPTSKRPPSGDHQLFISWWCYAYQTTQGKPYLFAAKDAKAVKSLLTIHPLKHLVLAACHFLTVDDAFLSNRRDLPMLLSQINRMPGPSDPAHNGGTRYRAAGLLPPTGVKFEDWRFYDTTPPDKELNDAA